MAKDALDNAVDLISPSIKFARNNFKDLFVKFFKVELVSSLAGIALFLLFSIIIMIPLLLFAGSLEKIPASVIGSGTLGMFVLFVYAAIAIFIITWIQSAFSSTAVIITKEQFEGTYSGIWPIFHRIKFQALSLLLARFLLVFAGVLIGLILPIALIFFMPESIISAIAILFWIIYLILFLLAFAFLTQFWEWELFINRKGVIESLKASISLARKNIIGVFVFDLLFVVASIVIGIPFLIVYLIGETVFRVGVFASMSFSSWILLIPALIIYIIFRAGLAFIQTAVDGALLNPYFYSFWKSLGPAKPSV